MRRIVLILVAISAYAQAPKSFEVASIKPAPQDAKGGDMRRDPAGGLTATNISLKALIKFAYQLQDFQLSGGPAWMTSDRFDIVCKAAEGSSKADTWVKLQNLLSDRFKLAAHRETKELPAYDLVVAKGGLKLQPLDRQPNEADGSFRTGNGTLTVKAVPMHDLVLVLSGIVRRPVTDRTGISGRYDFKLEYAPDDEKPDSPASDRPPLLVALQEQLGLRLESTRGSVEVVVIDHVERPTQN